MPNNIRLGESAPIPLKTISAMLVETGDAQTAVYVEALTRQPLPSFAVQLGGMDTSQLPKYAQKAVKRFLEGVLDVVDDLPINWQLSSMPVLEYIDYLAGLSPKKAQLLAQVFESIKLQEDDAQGDGDANEDGESKIVLSSTLGQESYWVTVYSTDGNYQVQVSTPDSTYTTNQDGDLVPLEDPQAVVFANMRQAISNGIDIIAYLDKEYAKGYLEKIPTETPEPQDDSSDDDSDTEDWMDDGGDAGDDFSGDDLYFDDNIEVGDAEDTGEEDTSTDNEEEPQS